MNILKDLYITKRFFVAFLPVMALWVTAYLYEPLWPLSSFALVPVFVAMFIDGYRLLVLKEPVQLERQTQQIWSLGEKAHITYKIKNRTQFRQFFSLIDELPFQFQLRDTSRDLSLHPHQELEIGLELEPHTRGKYTFGKTFIFLGSPWKIFERRLTFSEHKIHVAVYPSVIQMQKIQLMANADNQMSGLRKVRKIGHNYEFDHIKNYVQGDDLRAINWKASAKRSSLMSNFYEDEKAQYIYAVIDNGRSMQMPFHDLTLLEHSINSSLSFTNLALKRGDRAGLLSFGKDIHSFVVADNRPLQVRKIIQQLYNEQTEENEANYELLYSYARRNIRQRSMLMLYANFESKYAVERALPVLRRLKKLHLLVIVMFENAELSDYVNSNSQDIDTIYSKTIAEKLLFDKKQVVAQLKQYGIQVIYTTPKNLSINVVNKYLELKSRGMI